MISFEDVSLRYGEKQILSGIDLELSEQRIGILGANGSGKSSLVRCINGLVRPSSGTVRVNGTEVGADPAGVRAQVGFLFADPDSQIIMPTVAEDLAFSVRTLPAEQAKAAVDATMLRWGLSEHADHPCHLLSGGQKQVLALASVLLTEPTVLVADEPTTLLDLRNVRRLAASLAELPQQQVIITHSPELLTGFDRVLVLDEGRIVFDDLPAAAIFHYDRLMR